MEGEGAEDDGGRIKRILMNIDLIKPYPKNAKEHNAKQIKLIASSIKRFGFLQPIVIDKNNEIVARHGRYEAAKLLELKDVPIIKAETLTEQEIKAYRLADNQINALTGFKMNLVIEDLKGLDTDLLDLTGFDRDLIIDYFLGSGSTLIASEKTNRICYGMELSERYVDVIIKRWEDYTGKVAVKL